MTCARAGSVFALLVLLASGFGLACADSGAGGGAALPKDATAEVAPLVDAPTALEATADGAAEVSAPEVDVLDGAPDLSVAEATAPQADAEEASDAVQPAPDVTPLDAAAEIDTSALDLEPEPDGGVGADASAETSTPPVAGPVFDMALIADPSTAACTYTEPRPGFAGGVLLDLWNVSYTSWESIGGALVPITIRGYAARPAGKSGVPGIVVAHGLGGYAKESSASSTAALTSSLVIAYTGPGGGSEPANTSEGTPAAAQNGYRMFDVIPDLRGTWFWGHSVAAMRAVTCLASHPDVDPSRLGMTGFSAGGVATLLSSSVDARIVAGVPLSGMLAWDVATAAPAAWQHALLAQAGLSVASPEWTKLMAGLINPSALLAKTSTKLLLVDGTTDEFFPLTAFLSTYAVIGTDKRASLIGNFDHGCYAVTGVESAATIEERAEVRGRGGQRAWFAHHFGTDPDFAYFPQAPIVQIQPLGSVAAVMAVVDAGGSKLVVESVRVWWSNDDAFLFGYADLEEKSGVWSKLAAFPLAPNTIYFVDVQYKTKALLAPDRFSVSSLPVIPAGLVPHIRSKDTCL